MAQSVLDAGTELTKGAMVLGDKKEWIVAEAAGAPVIADDDAVAAAFRHGFNTSCWVGQGGDADIVGGPAILRERGQLRQQPRVVGRVVPLLAGIARRVDARPTVQSRHDQPAVLRQDPFL